MRFLKPMTLALMLMLLAASTGLAYNPPAFDGGCGLLKVSSPRTLGKGMLGVGFLQSDLSGPATTNGEPFFNGDTLSS